MKRNKMVHTLAQITQMGRTRRKISIFGSPMSPVIAPKKGGIYECRLYGERYVITGETECVFPRIKEEFLHIPGFGRENSGTAEEENREC